MPPEGSRPPPPNPADDPAPDPADGPADGPADNPVTPGAVARADLEALDAIEDPAAWAAAALASCLEVRARLVRRYRRRLHETDRVRDPEADVATLAARRVLPLTRRVLRPLPCEGQDAVARAFNRLEAADRFVLRRLDRLGSPRGARGLHLASALERLAQALDPADGDPPTGSRGDGPSGRPAD